jgi:hypothetical protein
MKDPEKMENYHSDNVTYPVMVRTYVRMHENWKLLSQSKVGSP